MYQNENKHLKQKSQYILNGEEKRRKEQKTIIITDCMLEKKAFLALTNYHYYIQSYIVWRHFHMKNKLMRDFIYQNVGKYCVLSRCIQINFSFAFILGKLNFVIRNSLTYKFKSILYSLQVKHQCIARNMRSSAQFFSSKNRWTQLIPEVFVCLELLYVAKLDVQNSTLRFYLKQKKIKKIAWIRSHHLQIQ